MTPEMPSTWTPSLSMSMQNKSFKCLLLSALKAAKALSVAGSSDRALYTVGFVSIAANHSGTWEIISSM